MRYARLFLNGCCIDMGVPVSSREKESEDGKAHKGGKRGRLRGKFSAASFRRLREYCVTHDCEGECWGITLTIPSNILHWFWVKDYVHRLSVWANYHDFPMIWRCELQQRGQAHLHIVCYSSAENCVRLCLQWQKLLMGSGLCLSCEYVEKGVKDLVWINRMFVAGAKHAFHLEKLSGDFRSWRYLVAHQSKGKLAQQGWIGRQWGVVNRALIKEVTGISLELDDRRAFYLRRWVRRMTRRRINTSGKHYLLVDPTTIKKMVQYLQTDDYFETPF